MSQLLLADLLSPDRVLIPIESTEKLDLIAELCAHLADRCGVSDEEEEIRAAVLKREAILSTGIGGGIAVPHGKSEVIGADLVLVAGVTREPVDFDALDARPVRLVLLLIGPESAAGLHVKILSRISRVLGRSKVRDRLIAAESPEDFVSILWDAESR